MFCTGAVPGNKSILHRRLGGNLSPLREGKPIASIDGQTALIELLSIVEHILTHLTQIDVEVASILAGGAFLTGIDKRIHQPELDVLDIGCLEVAGLQLAHHTSPLVGGMVKASLCIEVGIEVVRSSFVWIISQVQHWQRVGSTVIGTLVTIGI